ncbi:MAG TPA: AarF/UbiB family protein [Bellilinea sp.]|nr:AarF/UbiB family protein [Bellilinea sp.]
MLRQRYRKILFFFARVLLGLLWWEVFLPRIGLRRLMLRTRDKRLRQIALRFHDLAVDMGGVLIKVGQWLSARLDVLPTIITNELIGLQDEVQAENLTDIRRVIETEFRQPLEELFSEFDPQPIAAASIGQVHAARLRITDSPDAGADNARVVVKVQRPNIEALVETDLSALKVVSGWVELYKPIRRRVNVPALVREFSTTLYEEIDYLNEGQNVETFREKFFGVKDVIVPEVRWSHTTRRVLTLQDVRAIKITDYGAIDAAGIDRVEVSQRLFDVYLKQVFEDHWFHADPHPGNLFVAPGEKDESGRTSFSLVFVDFGMAGKITPNLVAGLRELIFAVVERDGARVIKAYQLMGVLLPGADIELLRRANERAFERFWGKTTPELMELRQTEAVEFLEEFRELLYNNPFQLPDNMILLGRALSILNGICTGLDTNFNVWHSVMPWAEKLVKAERGSQWKAWTGEAVDILRTLVALPRRTEALLDRLEQGRLDVRSSDVSRQAQRVNRSIRQLTAGIFFAAFLFGGVQLYSMGEMVLAMVLGGGAVVALFAAIFGRG